MISKKIIMEAINSGLSLEELKKNIESGVYEEENYEILSRGFTHSKIRDCYCNGVFGNDYELEEALIYRIVRDTMGTRITILKTNGEFKTGHFLPKYPWETVYEYLKNWTTEEEF